MCRVWVFAGSSSRELEDSRRTYLNTRRELSFAPYLYAKVAENMIEQALMSRLTINLFPNYRLL